MSANEIEIKPILIPLILGESIRLGHEKRTVLAKWIIMKVMVLEHSRPFDKYEEVIPQHDRTYLMEKNNPPPGRQWQIWIAHHHSQKWRAWYWGDFLRLARIGDAMPERVPEKPYIPKNTIAVSIGIGQFFCHTLFSTAPNIENRMYTFRDRLIPRIHPSNAVFRWPRGAPLREIDIDRIAFKVTDWAARVPHRPY